MQKLQTHYGLGPEKIADIRYDYAGPGGCQRKLVIATDGEVRVYIYHQRGNAWVIAENREAER